MSYPACQDGADPSYFLWQAYLVFLGLKLAVETVSHLD